MKNIIITVVVFLAGCASNSGVIPIGKDTFMVSRQAATGFSGSGTLKAEAFQEAAQYCEKLGKSLQVVIPFLIQRCNNYPSNSNGRNDGTNSEWTRSS